MPARLLPAAQPAPPTIPAPTPISRVFRRRQRQPDLSAGTSSPRPGPIRLLADTSGTHLFALDHDAPGTTSNSQAPSSATNPNTYCGTAILNATTCGDVTVFSVNATTGRRRWCQRSARHLDGKPGDLLPDPSQSDRLHLHQQLCDDGQRHGGHSQAGLPVHLQLFQRPVDGQPKHPAGPPGLAQQRQRPVAQTTAIVYASGKVYVLDNEPTTTNGTPSQISITIAPTARCSRSSAARWRMM